MDQVLYNSTRGGETGVAASKAILKGLASDGGLFVPDHIPALDVAVSDLAGKSYQEIADEIGKPPKSIDNALQRIKSKLTKAFDGSEDG